MEFKSVKIRKDLHTILQQLIVGKDISLQDKLDEILRKALEKELKRK